ncbi:hypothetical protein BAZSYMB_GCONTIG00653_3 [Bathymodiolus azoricus thioautotrophic gill symbiont]|uniref:Uncharacterized protein n=1 Tax=Bathymodiolus azoricus thioautotrophic gill symbiont TaxID=235205 RepID=A0A1H6LU51_9GAMM|nr:hypothetical protein BAZSYMB_GCONTIG00653_3 [Bathymodiolus azoricus thioautotrophic gill symbiont]
MPLNVATMSTISLGVLPPDFSNFSSPCPTNSILILSAFISCSLGPCTVR